MTATRTLITCSNCGRTRRSGGYGLCRQCYATSRRIRGQGAQGRPRRGTTIDEVAVARAVAGCAPAPVLNAAERRAAVHQLQAAGESIRTTALRVGIGERHVSRIRAALRAHRDQESGSARPVPQDGGFGRERPTGLDGGGVAA